MALNGYIKMIDNNHQWLKGDCDLEDRQGWIPVFAANHGVKFPTSAHACPQVNIFTYRLT